MREKDRQLRRRRQRRNKRRKRRQRDGGDGNFIDHREMSSRRKRPDPPGDDPGPENIEP